MAGSSSDVFHPGTPAVLVTMSRLPGAIVLPGRRCASVEASSVKNVCSGGLKSDAWNVVSACCGTDAGMPPLQTFFTLDASTEAQRRPGNTIAPGSLDIVTNTAGVPGWNTSLLLPAMLRGLIYRIPLGADGRSAGVPIECFKTTNRYRDLAVAPDQRTFYIVTDNDGRTIDDHGTPVRTVANPGAVLEFRYVAN